MKTTRQMINENLENLKLISKAGKTCVSIFIPINKSYTPPEKALDRLLKKANRILAHDGKEPIQIDRSALTRVLNKNITSLAVYNSDNHTLLIPIPFDMEANVVVASSFHIKPLIAARNWCVESLLVHIHYNGATLFRIKANHDIKVESYIPSGFTLSPEWPRAISRQGIKQFVELIKDDLKSFINESTQYIGITGSEYSIFQHKSIWEDLEKPVLFFNDSFFHDYPSLALASLQRKIFLSIEKNHEQSTRASLCKTWGFEKYDCIYELTQEIMRGNIKNLCISLEDMNYGVFDRVRGILRINQSQMCSTDDDLLDDLLEFAMEKGINVSVVPKDFMPSRVSFIAS